MKNIVIAVISCVLFVSGVHADVLKGQGEASYSVRATGHTVHGTVALEPFEATVTEVNGGKMISFKVNADILKMTTKKKKRDVEMHHVLDAGKHQMIQGEVKEVSFALLKADGGEAVSFPFFFGLAGITTEKDAEVLEFVESDGGLELTVGFEVSQLEHFLTPIKKMGFLKVKDTVHVEVHFTLVP